MSDSFSNNRNRYAVIGGVIIALLLFMTGMIYSSKAYASEEYWAIQTGGKTIATVASASDAEKVVEGVKNAYVTKGAKVESITLDKNLEIVNQRYKDGETPKLLSQEDAIKKIKKGVKEAQKYEIQDGDTTWEIASNHGLGYEELIGMNSDLDPENIMPGDKLTIEKEVPYVNVTTVQVINKTEIVAPEVQYEEDSSMYEGETKVKEEGAEGSKDVTLRETSINGAIKNNDVISEEIVKEAKPQIVLKGTKAKPSSTAKSASSYSVPSAAGLSGSGSSIASYATQFVGYPYVWGGTNLSTGVDCSGFVVAVYRNMGYNINRSFGSFGRSVSVSEMQPGDVILYSGHVSMYIGGGQEIHALNPSVGVRITGLGGAYVGPIRQVIRIVE